ncbi:hypothetical protein VRY54_02955 [Actinomyces sp. F1_1611]
MHTNWLTRLLDSLLVRPRLVAASPPVQLHSLDPDRVRASAQVKRLAELGPRNTRILRPDDLLNRATLAPLLRLSLEEGCAFWLITTSSTVEARRLQQAFPDQLAPLGPPSATGTQVFGVRPLVLLAWLLRVHPESVQSFLNLDASRIPRGARQQLAEAGLPLVRPPWLIRVARHPQFVIYLVFFLYATLRAVPASFVKEFHGNIYLFWAIDVITAIPYTWGVLTLLFAASWTKRMLGGVTTAVTFVAPYVYFWLQGKDYPLYVPVVIACLTALTVLTEVVKYVQERTLERHYRQRIPTLALVADSRLRRGLL